MLKKLLKCLAVPAFFVAALYPYAHAIPPPQVVIEDTLVLGTNVSTLFLDTTHFGRPTLLVGTSRAADGKSSVLRIETAPLRIVDTIFRAHHLPNLVRAAHLDDDAEVDYLIGLRSTYSDSAFFSGLVSLKGPGLSQTDTILFPRALTSVACDDITHEVWVGYVNDTSYTVDPGGFNEAYFSRCDGSILHFQSLSDTASILSADRAARDLRLIDLDSDAQTELVAFWHDFYSVCTAYGPAPDWIWAGVTIANKADSILLQSTWLMVGSDYACGLAVSLLWDSPVCLVDIDSDGFPEAILASYRQFIGPAGSFGLSAYSLRTGQSVWSLPHASTQTVGPPKVMLWDLDGDSVQEILTVRAGPAAIWAFKSSTGDSLFVASADNRFRSHALPVGPFGPAGGWRGVLYHQDSLFVFDLVDPTTAVGEGGDVRPTILELHPSFPNPFNASTMIRYRLEQPAELSLKIYDALGRRVETLATGLQPAGGHELKWEPKARGSGVYFIVLETSAGRQVQKALLLK